MPYIILLNELKGLELVIKALRNTRCIASGDLADGIERNAMYQAPDGKLTKLADMIEETGCGGSNADHTCQCKEKKVKSHLKVV
jgi:hypothetical protein